MEKPWEEPEVEFTIETSVQPTDFDELD